MAKTIKFNLICNGTQVRTLEDLRNNFLMEDVYNYYQNKLLERWLQVHNYAEHLAKVQAIGKKPKKDTIIDLINIFEVETDTEKINEGIYIMEYDESRVLFKQNMEAKQIASSESLDKYLQRYEDLKNEIMNNGNDKVRIQAIINEISTDYSWVFHVDYRNFFYQIKDVSPLAILCSLMNPFTRQFFIFDGDVPTIQNRRNEDTKEIYKWFSSYFANTDNIIALGEAVKIKADNTKGYISKVSPKKCLIIKMDSNCVIEEDRYNAKQFDYKLNGTFTIIDSLNYKSSSDYNNMLYYIEI